MNISKRAHGQAQAQAAGQGCDQPRMAHGLRPERAKQDRVELEGDRGRDAATIGIVDQAAGGDGV